MALGLGEICILAQGGIIDLSVPEKEVFFFQNR